MFKINVITQLLVFLILAIFINFMNLKALVVVMIMLLLILLINRIGSFIYAVMRFKWFFLVLLFIFVFNTPGEHLRAWSLSFGPTYEGISAGVTQILRIMIMLASLSLILACNTRQQLISGFYFLLLPLKYLGLKVERFAARLWLTLHYVEQQTDVLNKESFITQLKNMTDIKANHHNEIVNITFVVPSFNFADYLAISLAITGAISYMFSMY